MDADAVDPQLEALGVLVGTWATELSHPAFPGLVVSGRAAFEWLDGERFMLQRARTEHPDFPDSLSVIGFGADGVHAVRGADDAPGDAGDAPGDHLDLHYFDSRGVQRLYGASLSDGIWRIWRDAPGFSQRFTGTFADGGDTIAGQWELSRDDGTWAGDLAIAFRRAPA
jgi:hypothetical protein